MESRNALDTASQEARRAARQEKIIGNPAPFADKFCDTLAIKEEMTACKTT